MAINVSAPTRVEVDAAERVLAEAHGHAPDGYWRPLAEAALEAATRAQLKEALTAIDAELAGTETLLGWLRDAPADVVVVSS